MVDRIKALCKKRGISLVQFERESGVGERNVIRWDTNSPSIKKVQMAARYFGVTVSELLGETENAPGANPEAAALWEDFSALGDPGQRAVRAVIRELSSQPEQQKEQKRVKVIPLFGTAAAAGPGEPDTGNPWEDYEIAEDLTADFAVRISGDSMEPLLHDGQVALCRKGYPQIGDLVVVMVNGCLLCKQFISDGKNIFLRSLNRRRKDCDYDIWAMGNDTVKCYGTVILKSRPPLVKQ